MSSLKKVVIVGAGFGGLALARRLANHKNFSITLIDKRNHHLFQPLLYQVASAALSPAEIASPIRSIVSDAKNIEVRLEEVTKLNLQERQIKTFNHTIHYDFLVLACGSSHSYFGHPEWEDSAPGLKTLEQATEIRRRLLNTFEEAEACDHPKEREELLQIAVVGGGPTGVELAGAFAEICRSTLSKDFRRINANQAKVHLIEAGPRLLATFSERSSTQSKKDLEHLGVKVWLNSKVTKIENRTIEINSKPHRMGCIFWAAGVQPSALNRILSTQYHAELDRAGRVLVTKNLQLPAFENVFIIGDQAAVKGENGSVLPALAPVAMQEGRWLAKYFLQLSKGQSPSAAFRYRDKGQMATIGKARAVAELNGLWFSGALAWLAWLAVHIAYLIGFRNRILVLIQWAWAYVTNSRGARLILSRDWKH